MTWYTNERKCVTYEETVQSSETIVEYRDSNYINADEILRYHSNQHTNKLVHLITLDARQC